MLNQFNKDIVAKQKTQYILFKNLKNSKFQPDSRMKDDPTFKTMVEQFKNGIPCLTPPTVDKKGYIVDGHRRIRAMQEAGKIGCVCSVLDATDTDGKFIEWINTGLKLDGKQFLEIYMKNGSVPEKILKAVHKIIEYNDGDESILKKLLNYGKSGANPITLVNKMNKLKHYLGIKNYELSNKKILHWLLDNEAIYKVSHAIDDKMPQSLIKAKIDNNESVSVPTKIGVWKLMQKEMKAKHKRKTLAAE